MNDIIDVQLLRLMRTREGFYKLRGVLVPEALDKQTMAIVEDYGGYFEKFEDHKEIDFKTFGPWFRRKHPTLNDEQMVGYARILQQAQGEVDPCSRDGLVQQLHEIALGTKLANMLAQFDEGEVEDISHSVQDMLEAYKRGVGAREAAWIDTSIGELLEDEINEAGLTWRLQTLNECMRGLRGGDFGIIAGRPDKGKTTFVASEITQLASQLPRGRNALWLNNEGPGKRIVTRLYQAALGIPMSEMIRRNQQGRLEDDYIALMGRRDRIRVIDIHGWNIHQVEGLFETMQPGLVVFDMIDNIKGFEGAARTDLGLEAMYGWARERCVKFDMVGLATSQISNEGDGELYPTLGMLKDSKTGKQGACEFQLMIGASNDPNMAGVRGVGLPKNKLRREGRPGDPRTLVNFKPDIARYEDVPTAGGAEEETG